MRGIPLTQKGGYFRNAEQEGYRVKAVGKTIPPPYIPIFSKVRLNVEIKASAALDR